MATALITGGTGFIGWHLAGALQRRGDDVICLKRPSSSVGRLWEWDVRTVEGDVTDRASLERAVVGVDVVYHLAGLTKALRRRDLFAVNETGTRNLLAACGGPASPPVVVYVSSLAAAGPSEPGRPRREEDPPAPVSHYGRSKRAGELVCHEWAFAVPVCIVRPPLVFGEGDESVLRIFQPISRWGVHLTPSLADYSLSLLHAADLAAALPLVAERGGRLNPAGRLPRDQGYYFVAEDEPIRYAEFGRRIGQALDVRARVVRAPQFVTWAVAAGTELAARWRGRASVFNLDKAREAAAGNWTCSPARIRQLGWSCAADLDARLRQTVQWYRRQRWL